MKPCGVRIWVNDLEEGVVFYSEALGFDKKVDGLKDGWFIIGTSSIDLILEQALPADHPRYVGLSFYVDDIHQTCDDFRAKDIEIVSGPSQQDWGGWLADFKDCSGNTLTLVQNG